MSAIWRRFARLRLQGVSFAAAMRRARHEHDPDYRRLESDAIARWFDIDVPCDQADAIYRDAEEMRRLR